MGVRTGGGEGGARSGVGVGVVILFIVGGGVDGVGGVGAFGVVYADVVVLLLCMLLVFALLHF